MSGGVGPTGDGICLESDRKLLHDPAAGNVHRRFLPFRQLNALAIAVVLSASGMVAAEDLAFAVFSLPYFYFLAAAVFPSAAAVGRDAESFTSGRLLAGWAAGGALVGLVLPIAYILDGLLQGDKEGIGAAAPHVFLLACQVFAEGVVASGRRFSSPVHVIVPLTYNARRMFTIEDWVRAEIGKAAKDVESGPPRRLIVGQGLAVANLVFWGANLLGFLIPVYVPWAMRRYYAPPLAASKPKL